MSREISAVYSRVERFETVGSTNDIVRDWLAEGLDEIAIASADEQTAGRGRAGRSWVAPPGSSLLISAGFRPTYLSPERTWRLGAIVALAMAEAAETTAGLSTGAVRLKWPNDLVVEMSDGMRKVGGVLGETIGLGAADVRTVVGIGVNIDWGDVAPPDDLRPTLGSLATIARRPGSVDAVGAAFLDRLAEAAVRLRAGEFDAGAWTGRQATTGRMIVIETPDGVRDSVRAHGVDDHSGALLVGGLERGDEKAADAAPAVRAVHAADVIHVRLAGPGV